MPAPGTPAPSRPSPPSGSSRTWRWLPVALLPTAMAFAGGCSLANDAVSGVTAPIGALSATDVVVETNLKNALVTFGASSQFGVGVTGGSGFVSGPSTGPEVTSYAPVGSGGGLLVAWNDVDHHCLGALDIPQPLATPIIGESAAGTYYFVQTATPSSACAATLFAATPARPSSWPSGDPSSSSWPTS